MPKKLLAGMSALALSIFAAGCGDAATTSTENTNSTNSSVATQNPQTAPDNSEITVTESNGVKTETRVFKDPNNRVERVVVTTRGGQRTARVTYRSGEVRDLPENDVEKALDATGDAIVSAGGTVVDVAKEIGSEAADKTEDVVGGVADRAGTVADKTVDGAKKVGSATVEGGQTVIEKTGDAAKTVGSKTADGAKTVGSKTVDGAKTVGSKTADGAKKVGKKIGDIVTP